jgi:hypothetical protein
LTATWYESFNRIFSGTSYSEKNLPPPALRLSYPLYQLAIKGIFSPRGEPGVRPSLKGEHQVRPFNTNSQSNGGTGVSPVQAQAKACGYQNCSLNAMNPFLLSFNAEMPNRYYTASKSFKKR